MKRITVSVFLAALMLVSLFAVVSSPTSVSAQASGSGAGLVGGTMAGTSPAACTAFASNYQTYIVVTADSGAVWFTTASSGGSGTWQSLGGTATSSPAAVSWLSTYLRLDVFVRGTDGALWWKYYDNNWSGWQSLGGKLAPGTGPAVASWSEGRLDVFVTGTNGVLYHKWFANGVWSGWQSLGGKLTSSPAAASPITGGSTITVFVRGTDGAVWYREWTGTAWSNWQSLGGKLPAGTGPAVTLLGDVIVQGTDGQLWQKFLSSGAWSNSGNPPEALSVTSPGATTAVTMDHNMACVITASGNIWYSVCNSEGIFDQWYSVGSPSTTPTQPTTQLTISVYPTQVLIPCNYEGMLMPSTIVVDGNLTSNGAPVANGAVTLLQSFNGANYSQIGNTYTASDGSYQFTVPLTLGSSLFFSPTPGTYHFMTYFNGNVNGGPSGYTATYSTTATVTLIQLYCNAGTDAQNASL